MDLEKIAKALGLEGKCSPDQLRKALDAALLMDEARNGSPEEKPAEEAPLELPAVEEEEPAEEAELAIKEDRATEKKGSEKGEPEAIEPDKYKLSATETALTEVPAEKPAEEAPLADAPPADQKVEALEMLKQATGLDDAGALAFLRDNLEAISALAKGGASAPMGDSGEEFMNKAATARITALTAKLDATHAESVKALAAKDAELAALKTKINENEVDGLIRDGKILDSERAFAVQLASRDRSLFDQWYSSKGTSVPTGVVAKSVSLSVTDFQEDSDLVQVFERNLRHSIKDPKALRDAAVKAAKAHLDKQSA